MQTSADIRFKVISTPTISSLKNVGCPPSNISYFVMRDDESGTKIITIHYYVKRVISIAVVIILR